jgi:hypothetical protein
VKLGFAFLQYTKTKIFFPQVFFIDHTSRTTTFIDPRLPNELPILPPTSATPPASPHLVSIL